MYVGGEDYISVEAILEWHQDSPSLTQCVSVAIINDECVEEKEEMFTVSLSTEEECVDIGTNNQTIVTILDNDRESIQLLSYNYVFCWVTRKGLMVLMKALFCCRAACGFQRSRYGRGICWQCHLVYVHL